MISGEAPSSIKDQIGLGGGKTIRGINRNRVVGEGFLYGNAELRWKPVHFNWINQNFYIGLVGFFDFGQIVQNVDLVSRVSSSDILTQNEYFNLDEDDKLHTSYGAGLRVVMNENFILVFM